MIFLKVEKINNNIKRLKFPTRFGKCFLSCFNHSLHFKQVMESLVFVSNYQ